MIIFYIFDCFDVYFWIKRDQQNATIFICFENNQYFCLYTLLNSIHVHKKSSNQRQIGITQYIWNLILLQR